ncbi:MAG: anti-sigma factor [Chloroflexota bacterium]|nr:anti-sigma factor [Chloroflexota bacterium]
MSAPPLDHEQVIELLPDYAIGQLADADLDRVARHLEQCPSCRGELFVVLEIGGLLSDVAPARPAVRRQLLIVAEQAPAPRLAAVPTPEDDQPAPISISRRARDRRPSRGWNRTTQALLAATAAVLIVGLGIWNVRLREEVQQSSTIAAIVSGATVYPLLESQLADPASGVLLVGADGARGLLVADALPPLSAGEEFQVWLYDQQGQSSPAGRFSVDGEGRAQVELTPARPLASYAAVAISAEPADVGGAPSGPLALGGWLAPP